MRNIVIENKTEEHIMGNYFGQPFKINLTSKKDENEVLLDSESIEVIKDFQEQLKTNKMLQVGIRKTIKVCIEEGHDLFYYDLKVDHIEEESNDTDGNYFCTAYGVGVTDEDEELASEYTHMIDASNIVSVLS